MLLHLLNAIYGLSHFFDHVVYATMEPFQLVSARCSLAVLSKEFWSSFRLVCSNWLEIETNADIQSISKIMIDVDRHAWTLQESNVFLSNLTQGIPGIRSFVIRMGYIDFRSFDRFHDELERYLYGGGEHGPEVIILLPYGLKGIRAFRRQAPLRIYWFINSILSEYSVELQICHGCTTINGDDVTNFLES